MFGYVRPNIPELHVREKLRYDAWYCGLCYRLGKNYGLASRMCLSYDCTFLALTLAAADESAMPTEMRHCPFKPFGKKRPIIVSPSLALDFTAAVCVLLAKYKLEDDVRDGKWIRSIAKLPLLSSIKKVERDYPKLKLLISSKLHEFELIEKARTSSIDAPANAFGSLLSQLPAIAPINEKMRPVLSEMFFHIGRYIYLLDAWDDRNDDAAKGLYNPFLLSNADRATAEFLLNLSINSAIDALNLFNARFDGGLISNIVELGLFATADTVLNKTKSSLEGE